MAAWATGSDLQGREGTAPVPTGLTRLTWGFYLGTQDCVLRDEEGPFSWAGVEHREVDGKPLDHAE